MIIVILNGSNGVGKDTFADMCSKYADTKHISSVDYVKEMALKIGWDGIKDEDGRKLLHNLKLTLDAYRDTIWSDLMAKSEAERISGTEILFIDIREPPEITKAFHKFLDAGYTVCSVLVSREGNVANNEADKSVNDFDYDYFIDNNGTLADLDRIAHNFVGCMLNFNETEWSEI